MTPPVLNSNFTPHRAALPGFQRYQQRLPDAAILQEEFGKDMTGRWYGPYSPQMFLEKLMSIPASILKKMNKNVQFRLPIRKTETGRLEKHLYELFVS